MNRDRIQGNFKQFRGRLRRAWAQLRNDAVNEAEGAREILAGRLQEAYGIGCDRDEVPRRQVYGQSEGKRQ